jgi:hypothetical protein
LEENVNVCKEIANVIRTNKLEFEKIAKEWTLKYAK